MDKIFERLDNLLHGGETNEIKSLLISTQTEKLKDFENLQNFLQKLIVDIDALATIIENDEKLISVKNQKILRSCYQLITGLGISNCLLPGLGIPLVKRTSLNVTITNLTDEEKYELLTHCTNFFTRTYRVPILKSIIISLHLSDYLAALIQLAYAPLKKPGVYKTFTMTEDRYNKLQLERQKYVAVYEHLVTNCFQPILMKELLVLQSVNDPPIPVFAKKVISQEMSRRLMAPGGFLSLIRCFMETHAIDTGLDWKKIEMICKIVSVKHGNDSEDVYLSKISSQLMQILQSKNTHYLAIAIACILSLDKKYTNNVSVKALMTEVFDSFNLNTINSENNLPGTLILTANEVEHKVNIIHACLLTAQLEFSINKLMPNLYVLFLLGIKCNRNKDLSLKIKDILVKCLEKLSNSDAVSIVKMFLYGNNDISNNFVVEEYEAGLSIKCSVNKDLYPKRDAVTYFLDLFKQSAGIDFVKDLFKILLTLLTDISEKRLKKTEALPDDSNLELFNDNDENYAIILQILSEICSSEKLISSLKNNPEVVIDFIEYFVLKNWDSNNEFTSIALILLNTILLNTNKVNDLKKRCNNLIPTLRKAANDESNKNAILCREALSLLTSDGPVKSESAFEKVVSDIYDDLLPVRAHGIIELTKLIDSKDSETITKKHFAFCLLQEQLKDSDSYVYLAAINGIAALGLHCTEDVLQTLCKEFLDVSMKQQNADLKDEQNSIAEVRMKIGDSIVKVTRGLGEMAIVHKTLLLNTMLCACRDDDPFIRTSALSNLAEIALVLNYKIGSIIYELLHCVWCIVETDKAIECRRAAVMVVSSLFKGLSKDTLFQLKENLLPIYRTLKDLYNNTREDEIVRIHGQLALEELNSIVHDILKPKINIEKNIFVLDKPDDKFK